MTEKDKSKTLKAQNTPKLAAFVIANVVVFWSLLVAQDSDPVSIIARLSEVSLGGAAFGLLMPAVVVVLNGLVTPEKKAVLVFWRVRDPLPGCRAFSDFVHRDPRIDVPALQERLGSFPSEPKDQNTLWFRLLRKHDARPAVEAAHRDYLLTRDLTTLSFLFFLVLGPAIVVTPADLIVKALYLLALAGVYLVTRHSAQNYGEGFVCTVLAEEAAS